MRALLVFACLLTACQTTWREGAAITSPSGQRLCAKHRIPLVPLRAWQASTHSDRVILVHDAGHPYYGEAAEYCPNHIPEHISFSRGGIFQERTTVYYCRLCEKEFRERLRVPDEKAAIKVAQDVLTMRSGSKTKGPYHVTLDRDVWTVKCSLADGRPACITIGKEGTEISTQFPR
jgi:hypothetical protein